MSPRVRTSFDQVVHPVDAPQQRRFAAARGADDRGDLSLGHRHRDVEQGLLGPVPQRKVVDLQDGLFVEHLPCRIASIGSPRAIASRRLMPPRSAANLAAAGDLACSSLAAAAVSIIATPAFSFAGVPFIVSGGLDRGEAEIG
jgi:hypothetical protein